MKNRFPLAAAAVAFVLPALASANGLNLNGLGTRAQGMGGAFVSVADDFSAVFWNPAGAAGFRKELFGFRATDLMPRATFRQWPLTLEVPEDRRQDGGLAFPQLPGSLLQARRPQSRHRARDRYANSTPPDSAPLGTEKTSPG